MNQNQLQAVEDEELGQEEIQDNFDYKALYGGEEINIDTSKPPKTPAMEHSYAEIFADVAKQGIKETLVGFGSLYGNLTDLFGIKPDFLPNSEQLRESFETIGSPGKAETPYGEAAGRIGGLYGSGLVFGQANPIPAVVGGTAGQVTKELGGGELAQAAAEIVGMIASGKASKPKLAEKGKELAELGYTEKDVTLALNAEYKNSQRVKLASKGAKTEEAFRDFAEHSDDIVNGIFHSEVPGMSKGPKYVHELASQAYGAVADKAANMTIKNRKPFIDAANDIALELMENLGEKPEAKVFISRLQEALDATRNSPTAKSFINFYKELNGTGNWATRSEKDRWLTKMKNGIKQTFQAEGSEGKKLAEEFDKVNKGIQKSYKAEDVFDTLQKSKTQEGINYNKMYKLFDDPDNVKLFNEVLGNKQTDNWHKIAKLGKEVKDFDKAWKATSKLSEVQTFGALYYIFKGDFKSLAKLGLAKAGGKAVSKIAENSLTDPKMQDLMIRGLHAIKNESPRTLNSVTEGFRKYFEEQGIPIEL